MLQTRVFKRGPHYDSDQVAMAKTRYA